jgi:hypothetical protein
MLLLATASGLKKKDDSVGLWGTDSKSFYKATRPMPTGDGDFNFARRALLETD